MIDIIVTIIVILAMLWGAVRLGKTFHGIRTLSLSRRKFVVLRNMKGQRGAVQADYGVSVIVTGMPTSGRLERLMGLDFDNYEIVVVSDLQTEQHAQEIIRRYSMTRVNVPAAAEFRCDAIRTLLRSRQRRYRKLVIADCAAPPAAALNCAISVSSFGRIMVIDRRTCLNRGTLMRMDAEFESCSDGMICAVSAPVIDMNTFGCDTAVEIVAGEYSRHISMIDRDYAISTGGFSEDNEYMARMLADLRDIPGLKLSVIRTPLATCSGANRTFRVGGTRITVYLLLCVTAVATLLSILARRWDLIATLLLTLWMLYFVMVAIGILSLSAIQRETGPYPIVKTLLEPFVYPFYPQKGSLMEKNFSKS